MNADSDDRIDCPGRGTSCPGPKMTALEFTSLSCSHYPPGDVLGKALAYASMIPLFLVVFQASKVYCRRSVCTPTPGRAVLRPGRKGRGDLHGAPFPAASSNRLHNSGGGPPPPCRCRELHEAYILMGLLGTEVATRVLKELLQHPRPAATCEALRLCHSHGEARGWPRPPMPAHRPRPRPLHASLPPGRSMRLPADVAAWCRLLQACPARTPA